MARFDRDSRQRPREEQVRPDASDDGPSRRRWGGIGFGVATIMLFVVAFVLVDSGCTPDARVAPGSVILMSQDAWS